MLLEDLRHFFIIPFIIGIIGGLAAYFFRLLVKLFTAFYQYIDFMHNNYFYLITMPLFFLVSHFLISKFLRNHSNVTIDEIAKKISMMSGKFSFIKGFLVLFLTSFSLGFGVPIGREGPIAKLGGLVSEIFLLAIKVQRVNLPIYLSAGVSAAISATFNAPIAGIIFGIEIIIGRINSYIVIPLLVACATSTMIARELIGDFTAFYVPKLTFNEAYFPYLPVIAIFIAILALILNFSLKKFRKYRLMYWKYWKIAVLLLGLAVGLIIVVVPEVKGVGYNFVDKIFANDYSELNVFKIMLAKLLAVILSIGSGVFGGLMSPSIFIGSFSGVWFGDVVSQINPYLDSRTFALIGSAAMLAGVAKAPLRSSIIITELTHSYQLLLPILITSAITSYLLSKIESGSYFKRSLMQRGIDIENEGIINFLKKCKLDRFVENIPPITPDISLKNVIKIFRQAHVNYLAVVNEDNKLIGIISLRDVRKSSLFSKKELTVQDLMSKNPFAIYKEHKLENIYKALSLLNASHIPYIDKEKKYIGMLNMNALIKELTLHQQAFELKDKVID